jgi:hypothetical protein
VIRFAHQRVFSTGDWWDFEEVTPGIYRRVYVAEHDAPPLTEQPTVLVVYREMLQEATGDGGRKRAAGLKPPWWKDLAHEPALFSHLSAWKHGVQRDADSGAHPLVHLAWRALALAYQETHGLVDPAVDRCVMCHQRLEGAFYGMGDGSGSKFACAVCWETKR